MASTKHHLRKQFNTFYFQLAVPADLQSALGKKVILSSLKTSKFPEAAARRDVLLAEWRLRFAELRKGQQMFKGPETARDLLEEAKLLRAKLTAGLLTEAEAREVWAYTGWRLEDNHYLVPGERFPVDVEQALETSTKILAGEVTTTLSEAIARYLEAAEPRVTPQTLQAKRRRLEALQADLGDIPLGELTRQAAASFVTRVLGPSGTSPKTRQDFLADLRAAAEHWCLAGYLPDNPFARLGTLVRGSTRGSTPTRRPWADEELVKLFAELDGNLRRLALIALYSGMRLNEIAEMRWENVTENAFEVTEGKTTSSVRAVPIHPTLRPWLSEWRRGEWVIPGLRPGGENARRGHTISKRFGRLKTRAGFGKELVFHGLRSSFITKLEQASVPESTVALIVGHARQNMSFGTYSGGASFEQLAAAVSRVRYAGLRCV